MASEKDNIHPDKIFWFIVGITIFVFLYVVAITFIRIPKENVRFVDVAIGFLLGTVLSSGIGYLLVSSPGKKKEEDKQPTP